MEKVNSKVGFFDNSIADAFNKLKESRDEQNLYKHLTTAFAVLEKNPQILELTDKDGFDWFSEDKTLITEKLVCADSIWVRYKDTPLVRFSLADLTTNISFLKAMWKIRIEKIKDYKGWGDLQIELINDLTHAYQGSNFAKICSEFIGEENQ